jgi:replication-associated recombination protein RarA
MKLSSARQRHIPLAETMRPDSLDDYFGQVAIL